MPRISALLRVAVRGAGGRDLGRVNAVLFHPTEPRVVGVQVDPGAVLGVVDRKPFFAVLGDLGVSDDALVLPSDKAPARTAGEKALGFPWDESVIWRGMPVVSAGGDTVGTVHDAQFRRETGEVTMLVVSTGIVGDAAVGKLEVPGEMVQGFDGDAVRVLPGYNDIDARGGAAKAAASGIAAVKVRGGQVADGAMQVGVAAAGALGRSLKSGIGRKAIDKLKSLMDEDE